MYKRLYEIPWDYKSKCHRSISENRLRACLTLLNIIMHISKGTLDLFVRRLRLWLAKCLFILPLNDWNSSSQVGLASSPVYVQP